MRCTPRPAVEVDILKDVDWIMCNPPSSAKRYSKIPLDLTMIVMCQKDPIVLYSPFLKTHISFNTRILRLGALLDRLHVVYKDHGRVRFTGVSLDNVL